MSLANLPTNLLPREKLLSQGAASLSDTELLAVLLRTGTAGRNVLLMAQDVLDTCGGIAGLLHSDAASLKRIKGLGGNAKRAELLAVMEVARRAIAQQLKQGVCLNQTQLAKDYVQLHLAQRKQECFAVLFLDTQYRLIQMDILFEGTLNQAQVYPREVARYCLHHNAAHVILAHNHPSGCSSISEADRTLTQHLQQALAVLDITVLDHLIVTQGSTISMAQQGILL